MAEAQASPKRSKRICSGRHKKQGTSYRMRGSPLPKPTGVFRRRDCHVPLARSQLHKAMHLLRGRQITGSGT